MKTYDAGIERETLARELAIWKVGGFMDSTRAARWRRRTRRLAGAIGQTIDRVVSELHADADLIHSDEN